MPGLRSFIAWWMGGAGKLASTAVSPTQYICSHTDVSRIVTESDFIPVVVYSDIDSTFSAASRRVVAHTNSATISASTTRAC